MIKKMTNKALWLVISMVLAGMTACNQPAAPEKVTEQETVKNIIFLIGDGMGLTYVTAGSAVAKQLHMERAPYIGLIRTQSASSFITDSAAAGTAFSTGKRTYNGGLGVGLDSLPLPTILEIAAAQGLGTGLVATASITHATPAAFIAHQASRNSYEDIALDFLNTDITVFIGGGYDHFSKREDGKNLLPVLQERGYEVTTTLEATMASTSTKLAGLLYPEHAPKMTENRGDMLPMATQKALEILKPQQKGFFIMIEGSQIDWAGHANDAEYGVAEVLDFDKAVGVAFDFADKNPGTLVVVTADHETGGLGLNGMNKETGELMTGFTSKGHTGTMVPVFAYGTGAEHFKGVYNNTDIFEKFMALLGLKEQ